VPILVVSDQWRSSPVTQELEDAGFLIVGSQDSLPTHSAAHECAKEIRGLLVHLPYDFKMIEDHSAMLERMEEILTAVAMNFSIEDRSAMLERGMEESLNSIRQKLTQVESAKKPANLQKASENGSISTTTP
jgi:hypothetical protein